MLDLIESGKAPDSPKEIARLTKIPVSTCAKRLRKFREQGILVTIVRRSKEYGYRALISIDLNLTQMKSTEFEYRNQHEFVLLVRGGLRAVEEFKPFMEDIHIEQVYVLLGGKSDICTLVAGKSVGAVYNFVTRVIHALPGVTNTNTAAIPPDD